MNCIPGGKSPEQDPVTKKIHVYENIVKWKHQIHLDVLSRSTVCPAR